MSRELAHVPPGNRQTGIFASGPIFRPLHQPLPYGIQLFRQAMPSPAKEETTVSNPLTMATPLRRAALRRFASCAILQLRLAA